MEFAAILTALVEAFNKNTISYALIGGFALTAAHCPRATQDIDFLIEQSDASPVTSLLKSLGYTLHHESPDVLNFVGALDTQGNIDFLLAHRSYTKRMLAEAIAVSAPGMQHSLRYVKPEDLIGLKIQSSSNDPQRMHQDMADIQSVISANHDSLDYVRVREYFALFNREAELDDLLRTLEDTYAE